MTAPEITGAELLELGFPPAMTADALRELRSSLDATRNTNLVAFYGFLMLDRDAMVAMIKSVADESNSDEALDIVKALADVRDNFERIVTLAEMIEARALVAAHVALGVSFDETTPPLSPWKTAWALVESERRRDAEVDAAHTAAQLDGTITAEQEQAWSDSIDPLSDAEWALFAVPAPDLAALEWKLNFLRDRGLIDSDADRLVADVKHLAEQAA